MKRHRFLQSCFLTTLEIFLCVLPLFFARGQCVQDPFHLNMSLTATSATLRVTGPYNELFLIESSTNLSNWAGVRTNNLNRGMREFALGPAMMRQGFFRSRRFEDAGGCGTHEFSPKIDALQAAANECP